MDLREHSLQIPIKSSSKNILNSIKGLPDKDFLNAKPFVKWVGGKRSAIKHLKERMPIKYTCYYEIFLGGGALFFEIRPSRAVLCDINDKLISTYKTIKKSPELVIKELKKHQLNNSKEYYYKKRAQFNKEKDSIKLASLFIYLNKVGFNGLYRVNQSGGFNVPFGKYKNPKIVDEENILNVSKILKKAKIYMKSFDQVKVEKGAFYYLDPPYHKTYDQYDKNQFNFELHKTLASFCKKLNKRGALFMLSNSDTPEIRKLYKEFKIEPIEVGKSVSCKSDGRKKEKELVIRNYG